jgi:hypothetical protein
LRFDTTINLGNILVAGSFILMAIIAWRDLTWRIKNLETWRREHMIDEEARDQIIARLDKIVAFIEREIQNRGKRAGGDDWRQK